jgi:signal transduction histidine kinase
MTAEAGVSDYARRVTTDSRRRDFLIDLALCVVLLGLSIPVTMQSGEVGAGTVIDTLVLPAVALPVLWRRRAPFGAAAAMAVACVVSGIPTFNQFRLGVAIPAAMLVLYSLASRAERRRALVGLALVLVGMVFIGLTDVVLEDGGGVAGMIVFSFPLCVGSWGMGRLVRSRDALAGELVERSRLLERQREETAELAVEVERTRLASDLDAAARVRLREVIDLATRGEESLAAQPDAARESYAVIERTGRDSLNELRGLLGVLRSDQRASRSPRPTLAQIDTLLADARAGGRLVDLEVDGESRPLPGGVELAAYRALQHALVAVSGGDDEPARVRLSYQAAALELEVRGFPTAGAGAKAAVAAARERVVAHGGSFRADASGAGQRILTARLPVAATGA